MIQIEIVEQATQAAHPVEWQTPFGRYPDDPFWPMRRKISELGASRDTHIIRASRIARHWMEVWSLRHGSRDLKFERDDTDECQVRTSFDRIMLEITDDLPRAQ